MTIELRIKIELSIYVYIRTLWIEYTEAFGNTHVETQHQKAVLVNVLLLRIYTRYYPPYRVLCYGINVTSAIDKKQCEIITKIITLLRKVLKNNK